jgi:hypothetical protein
MFAHQHLGTRPTAMNLADITSALILAFLDHLEQERHNSVCIGNYQCESGGNRVRRRGLRPFAW